MAEESLSRRQRRPIRNFIILPDVQWPYIIRLLAIINLAGVLMAVSICTLFYLRYSGHLSDGQEFAVDPAGDGIMQALVEENLMDVVIPAFVIADLVSLAMGLALSLYFSRKISVPIYRMGKWAEAVTGGDLAYRLKFRPGDDLQPMEDACNRVGETYCAIIDDLRRQITEANLPLPARLAAISTQPKQRSRPEPSGAA